MRAPWEPLALGIAQERISSCGLDHFADHDCCDARGLKRDRYLIERHASNRGRASVDDGVQGKRQ